MRPIGLRWVLAVLFLLTACPPPEPGGGPGPEPEEPAKKLPGGITGFSATQTNDDYVALKWNERADVTGYRVYRQDSLLSAPRLLAARRFDLKAKPVGDVLAETEERTYTDETVEVGKRYSYQVVGFNDLGDGPPSTPVTILVRDRSPVSYDAWPHAPVANDNPGGGGGGGSNPVDVVLGGNAGTTSTTAFPEAVSIANCQVEGFHVSEIRPAATDVLTPGLQTFTVKFAYNVTEPEYYIVAAEASLDPFNNLIWEYNATGTGCNEEVISYTIDLTDIDPTDVIQLVVYSQYDIYQFTYLLPESKFVRIISTVPEAGSELSGGDLTVTVEHHQVDPGELQLRVRGGWETIGHLVTDVTGDGQFTVTIPYESKCGFDDISLTTYLESGGREYRDSRYFVANMPGDVRFEPDDPIVWTEATNNWGVDVGLDARPCSSTGPVPVTFSTDRGYISMYDWNIDQYVTGTTLTVSSDDYVELFIEGETLEALGYGAHIVNLTAQIGAYPATAATVELNLYDAFWKTPPPAEAVGGQAYPVEVTGFNLPTLATVYVDTWAEQFPLTWDGSQYSGWVTYTTCGWQWNDLVFEIDGSYSSPLWESTDVISSSVYSLEADYWWVDLLPNGMVEPIDVGINEACGGSIQWSVTEAPSWVRFESLTGQTGTNVRMVLDSAAAATASPGGSDWGIVVISPVPSGEPVEIEVYYSY